MRPRLVARLLALALLVVVPARADLAIYDDALVDAWEYWGWATQPAQYDPNHGGTVHAGARAIAFEPDDWVGLQFHHAALAVEDYEAVRFWAHGGAVGGQQIRIQLAGTGAPVVRTVAAGWQEITITFAQLGVATTHLDVVVFQGAANGDQATVYLDDIALVSNSVPPPPPGPVTVSVDPSADRRPISPLIYGVNFASASRIGPVGYTVNRWGGNATTRYNWEHATHNTAMDWFFMNVPDAVANVATLPHGSSSDAFIDTTRAAGAQPLMTVGTIGWAPLDSREKAWGFSVATYGEQQLDECDLGDPSWCIDDAGNGVLANGSRVVGNLPSDTSKQVYPDYAADWMAHVASRIGTAAAGGVKYWALDNESMLWHDTHRDVHPEKLDYEALWQYTVAYATAMKTQDPAIEIFGPVTWGWCDLWGSAADVSDDPTDDCTNGPDRAELAHAWSGDFQPCEGCDLPADQGAPLVPWYLHQVCSNPIGTGPAAGRRLVDWLDIHYYPQGDGVTGLVRDDQQAIEDDAAVIARRDRSLRELWDPAWAAESWVANSGVPVRLLRRLAQWRDAYCPGMKLALTEYKWGKDDTPSGALAQAEVLAIFGREGLDLATRWVAPKSGQRAEDAFRIFRNYDGAGGRVEGDSARAVSTDGEVGSYAVRADDGTLFVLLFNRDDVARDITVTVAEGITGAVALWRFGPTARLASAGNVPRSGDGFASSLPPRSATLARVALAAGAQGLFSDGFETGGHGRWSERMPL